MNPHRSLECTSTHNTAQEESCSSVQIASVFCERGPVERALYFSKSLADQQKRSEAMADHGVSNECVKVNTREDKRPGVLNAMQMLLGSATLNSDYLSLGVGAEQKMMKEAYSGVIAPRRLRLPAPTPR